MNKMARVKVRSSFTPFAFMSAQMAIFVQKSETDEHALMPLPSKFSRLAQPRHQIPSVLRIHVCKYSNKHRFCVEAQAEIRQRHSIFIAQPKWNEVNIVPNLIRRHFK